METTTASLAGLPEKTADRVGLAADAQRVDLQLRLGDGADGRGNLEHVGAHVELALALGEVVGVVLHEGGATLKAVAHDGTDAHEDGGLPVAFSGEAPAVLGREALQADATAAAAERRGPRSCRRRRCSRWRASC